MTVKCPKCQFENTSDSKFCKECGTQLIPSKEPKVSVTETIETPTEELTRGSTFTGRYEIIEELGKGGMGKVYRVEDKKIKEEVALKLIKPEIASDKKTLERFSNELKMARKIAHRNVCKMYELMEEKGTRFITMEYVPGQDLKGLIKQSRQLTAGTALSIAMQVCEGLAEAHKLGVVHRDLKPSNIMIDKEGNARIMDFGIARSLEATGTTGAAVMIGTPEYMSPEQVEGKEVDQRSDIYSLGIILYEMVTGRVPFEGETPLGIAMKHKTEEPPDPKKLNAQIPEDLNRMILRCLEKDKERRYQSAGEVHSELTSIERGIPITERVVLERKPITSKEITVTFSLKKLFIPAVVIAALLIAAVILWKRILPKQASIAVLPFTDLSSQKDQELLCDGMTEEIISKLSGLEGWKVISRTSVMRYKRTDKDIKEIGRELDVSAILEGSVRQEKDDIRVTVELINVKDRSQLWSDTYDQKLKGVFAIQSDIAQEITKALKMRLSPQENERLQKKPTDNIEAYNLYLKGRYFWNRRTVEEMKKAQDYFTQAIEIDPNFALAYAGLADSYCTLGDLLDEEKAKEAVKKALDIDDTLAEAHTSLASIIIQFDSDLEAAEKEYKRAIELNPGYATAHHWYANLLIQMSKFDEAINEIKRAHALDPLSLAINRSMGIVFFWARQYDRAIEALKKTIEMDPNFIAVHIFLGRVYLQKSMYEEALTEFQKEKEIIKNWIPSLQHLIGITYAKMGKKEEAQQVLSDFLEKSKPGKSGAYFIATLYFVLGENDKGFEWLENAYEERNPYLWSLKIDPELDSVRSDPRFTELLKKMNLE